MTDELPATRSQPLEEVEDAPQFDGLGSVFSSAQAFDLAVRMATVIATATAIPLGYQDNPANCLIAIDYAKRLRVSPAVLMQNMSLEHGRPALGGAFLIAIVNACGLFERLRFEWQGQEDDGTGQPSADYGCRAYTTALSTGERLNGNFVTWAMVVAEGWSRDNGELPSKWNTMRKQMFEYRAAAFWSRVNSPDITLGLHTSDEVEELPQRSLRKAKAESATEDARSALRTQLAARAIEISEKAPTTTEPSPEPSRAADVETDTAVDPDPPKRRRSNRAPIE